MTQEQPQALPSPVRARLAGFASEFLGTLPPADVPAALKAIARFTPARRARVGAPALTAALQTDPVFRQRVGAWTRERHEALATTMDGGEYPTAADPIDVAAVAYVVRPQEWEQLLSRAVAALAADAVHSASAQANVAVDRLTEQLAATRESARTELDRARAQGENNRTELVEARRKIRELEAETARLRHKVAVAEKASGQVAELAAASATTTSVELRRLRARLVEAESAIEAGRRASREGRSADDLRLRLLLDTVLEAAQGLQRELALSPNGVDRPADTVAAVAPRIIGVADVAARAQASDAPARLDQLLALPQVHLVVDGYNVTKSGYGTLTLADQRHRLLSGLAVLAGQTRAEVTCVFDGAEVGGVTLQVSPRGVRVLFSPPGVTADEVIRQLVRAEPQGRPVVVVSSDREVAEGVANAGARPVPSSLLLRRLERA